MEKSKLIKKIGLVLGVIGVVSVGVIGTSLVKAAEDEPNMGIEVVVKDDEKNINIFENKTFDVNIKINPGKIKYESANTPNTISGTKIVLDSKDFQVVSSTIGTVKENNVNLGVIDYRYDGVGFNVGTSFNLTLKIKALKVGEYNGENSFNKLIKLYHKNVQGSDSTVKIDDEDGKLNVVADKIDYVNPKIVGGEFLPNYRVNPENDNKIVTFGELIELNYELVPSEIMTAVKNEEANESISRKLIYILDEGALSKKGENGELAKDTLINSLNSLKTNNPKQEVALITYGSIAKVLKSSDKDFYSIDEAIKNINEIKSDEKSGNLGDALRQAQWLINESKKDNISVVLVSEGNPAYFTKSSDGKMLSEFSNKNGEVGTGFEEGKEYVEEIVTLINKENEKNERDVRWFNINYGTSENQKNSTEAIEALGGENSKSVVPTVEDFKIVSRNATADLIIEGDIKAEGTVKIKVAPESNQKIKIYYNYKKDSTGKVEVNEKGQKTLIPFMEDSSGQQLTSLPFKVGLKFLSATELDLADPEVLKVSFKADIKDSKEVIFNKKENIVDHVTVEWNVESEVNYLKITGLHNGKLENIQTARDGNYDVESLAYMEGIARQIFDGVNVAEFAMSKENTFRSGVLLKVNAESNIEAFIGESGNDTKSNIRESDITWKIYEYDQKNSKFTNEMTKAYRDVKIIKPNTLYLIVTDCFIPDNADTNSTFNIGYKLTVKEAVTLPASNVVVDNQDTESGVDPLLQGGVNRPAVEPSVEGAQIKVTEDDTEVQSNPQPQIQVKQENLYDKYFLEERTRSEENKDIKPIEIETRIIVKDKPEHY